MVSLLKESPVELTNTQFQVQEENVQWSIFMLETLLCLGTLQWILLKRAAFLRSSVISPQQETIICNTNFPQNFANPSLQGFHLSLFPLHSTESLTAVIQNQIWLIFIFSLWQLKGIISFLTRRTWANRVRAGVLNPKRTFSSAFHCVHFWWDAQKEGWRMQWVVSALGALMPWKEKASKSRHTRAQNISGKRHWL